MSANRHLYLLAIALTVIGLAIFFVKWRVLHFPLQPNSETQVWNVEAAVTFQPGPAAVKVTLRLPTLIAGYTVLDESFVSRGFGVSQQTTANGREAVWAVREAQGSQTVFYRATILKDPSRVVEDTTPPFPAEPSLDEPSKIAMEGLIAEVRRQSADVGSFTAELLKRIQHGETDSYIALFLPRAATPEQKAQLATIVLAAAHVPARVAHGVSLRTQNGTVQPSPLLEVNDGEQWLYFNPATLERGRPDDFFIWWRGDIGIADVEGGSDTSFRLAVQQNVLESMLVVERRTEQIGSHAMDYSLFSLPIATQSVYAVLLMVPIGALVIVVLRNFVGVKTFGTFMPVLVALAFRETRLFWGVLLFAVIVSLGLLIRFYFERLRLLLVPRLSSVLTVVVMLMAGISVVSHKLDLQPALSIALFPMVIIAMTIERMSIVWEERGASEAVQEGFGSLLVAALTYLVMGITWLEHLIFVFPELLLLVLALILLIGRYTGYRLFELRRFRAFAPSKVSG